MTRTNADETMEAPSARLVAAYMRLPDGLETVLTPQRLREAPCLCPVACMAAIGRPRWPQRRSVPGTLRGGLLLSPPLLACVQLPSNYCSCGPTFNC
jgi:hypothetical protein